MSDAELLALLEKLKTSEDEAEIAELSRQVELGVFGAS
jgi:hypothetical protein